MKYYLNSIQLTVISEGTPIEHADELGEMTDLGLATFDVRSTEISAKRAATFVKDCGVEDFVIVDDDEDWSDAKEIAWEDAQIEHALRHERAELKKRTAYPEFCTQPEKCAGKGKCMNDWVCND